MFKNIVFGLLLSSSFWMMLNPNPSLKSISCGVGLTLILLALSERQLNRIEDKTQAL